MNLSRPQLFEKYRFGESLSIFGMEIESFLEMERNLVTSPQAYKIISTLAETASSEIYEVKRVDSKSQWSARCVMKILKSKKMVHECIHEFESLKKVRSINCVQVYTWEWIDGRPALIMEYISGINLNNVIKSGIQLSEHEIAWILASVDSGLNDLKNAGLIHGDLHPRNVLITDKGVIKLIDYGMANFMPGMEKFTPNYCAPEVLSSRHYSYKSDLYSLGRIGEYLGANSKQLLYLLNTNPQKRTFKSHDINSKVAKRLGQKIFEKLRGAKEIQPTMRFSELRASRVPLLKWQNILSMVSLSMFFASSFALAPDSDKLGAKLSVKTLKWVDIEIPQIVKCSSPCEGQTIPSGQHKLSWRTLKSKGAFTLTVSPGEHKVLSDKYFE